jgi:hypothetical protein
MNYKPTNPEAGPSDTVPAMLTPGEAVIPAPVAQDPNFKPMIQNMVQEGRDRNDMMEMGIPLEASPQVTIMPLPPLPSEKEMAAMLQGDVAKEQAVIKAALENNKVERNQKALDQTYYGVPQIQEAPPQPQYTNSNSNVMGYAGGTDDAGPMQYYFDESDNPLTRLGKGIAYPFVKAYDFVSDEETNKKLADAMMTSAEVNRLSTPQEIAKTITTPLNDPRFDSPVKAEVPAVTNTEPPQQAFSLSDSAPVAVDPKQQQRGAALKSQEELEALALASAGKVPDEKPGIFGQFVGGLKEAFDPAAIAKGAVGYGLSSLLTNDYKQAAKTGLSMYADELSSEDYDKALIRSGVGKYTPESLEAYRVSGDVSQLVPVAGATAGSGGYTLSGDKYGFVDGHRVNVFKDLATKSEFYKVGSQYIPVNKGDSYGISRYRAEYHNPDTITQDFRTEGKNLAEFANTSLKNKGSEFTIANNPVVDEQFSTLYFNDVRSNRIKPEYQQAYRDQARAAQKDYYDASAKAVDSDEPTPLNPDAFYNRRKLHLELRYKDAKGNMVQKLSYADFKDAKPELLQETLNIVRNSKEKGVGLNQEMQGAKAMFDVYKTEHPKDAAAYAKQAAKLGHSPFSWFLNRAYSDKPDANFINQLNKLKPKE